MHFNHYITPMYVYLAKFSNENFILKRLPIARKIITLATIGTVTAANIVTTNTENWKKPLI